MNPDGFDDVRVLLREIDPAPLPVLDVDAILRGGELERRRRARSRWYAVAAALLVVAAVGAGLLSIARPQAAGPVGPGVPSSTFAPTPFSPQTWLLYAQPGVDAASSVHYAAVLGTSPTGVTLTVDTELGVSSAQGTLDAEGVVSRYLTTSDGVSYVEPAVLVKTGVIKAGEAGSATWVRLSAPLESRFRVPSSVRGVADVGYFSGFDPAYGTSRVIDGTPATAIDTGYDVGDGTVQAQTIYLTTTAPYLPLLVERDGKEVARFTDWNAPVAPPVAPPASEVVAIPGL